MFEQFPYTDMHQLNLDWIIKIAKDFLDQYTQIQNTIQTGLDDLDAKAEQLEGLLQAWYDTHSEDIANQLSDALRDLNAWYTEHSADIADELASAISAFNTAAENKSQALLDSWPEDYSALVTGFNALDSAVYSMNPEFHSSDFEFLVRWTVNSSGTFTSNPSTSATRPYAVKGGTKFVNKSNATGMNDKPTICYVAEYKNGVFQAGRRTDVSTPGSSVVILDDTDTVRIVFGYTNASGNTASEEDLAANFAMQVIGPVVYQIEIDDIRTCTVELATNPLEGYVNSESGVISDSSSYQRTDYIKVASGVTYTYSGLVYSYAGGAAYDENKEYLGALLETYPDGSLKSDFALTLPAGTVYIVVCSTASQTLSLKATGSVANVLQDVILNTNERLLALEQANQEMKPEQITTPALFERIAGCGDSFTSGAIYGIPGQSATAHYAISWPAILGRKLGCTGIAFADIGVNAGDWLESAHGLPLLQDTDPCNLYIIMLGINTEDVGTIDDVNDVSPYTPVNDTFYGNIAKIYHEIHDYAPNAKIILARPPITSGAKATALQTLAERYSIPYMDYASDPFFDTDYYADNKETGHPLAVGYAGMALAMERQLVKCMIDNASYFRDYVGND